MAGERTPPAKAPKPSAELGSSVREVIEPVVAAAGADLEDVQLRRAGSRLLLRVLIDTDGGVTLDEAAAVANAVSAALDDSGAMGDRAYVLDVGSPGVDRPLTLVRHWRRNIGRLVRVTTTDGSVVNGRIEGVSGDADDAVPGTCVLEVAGRRRTLDGSAVRRAVVQIEFTDGATDGDAEE